VDDAGEGEPTQAALHGLDEIADPRLRAQIAAVGSKFPH
jgi:hypothetical protein